MAKMSTSRIVTLVLTGGQILFCIILIGVAFAIPKAQATLTAFCLVSGFFGLFIPIMGFCGILCKNTCLMMVYIVCCIIDMLNLAVIVPLVMVAAVHVTTDEGKVKFEENRLKWAKEEFEKGNYDKKLSDYGTPSSVSGALWGIAAVSVLNLVWMGANTFFYFKARKEVKAEEMRGAFGGGGAPGYPPAPGYGYPPPGSFPPSTPSQPSQPSMPSR